MWIETIMNNEVIHALSMMILHSFWQGSVIAFVLAIFLRHVPEGQSSLRFNASAFALFSMLLTALVTFLCSLGHQVSDLIEVTTIGAVIAPNFASPTFGISVADYAVVIWLVGLIVLYARFLLGYSYLRRISSQASPIIGPAQKLVSQIKSRLRIRISIRLLESKSITAPMTIGHLKPVILFPLGFVMNLTPAQMEAIIAHELAHIKRDDYVMNLFYSLIEILFYYHPAIWWISAQMQHEREACCDDLAIGLTGDKKGYLSTLWALQESVETPRLALSLLGHSNSLARRFSRHLQTSNKHHKTMEKLTIGSLLLIGLLGLSFKTAEHKTNTWTDTVIEKELEIVVHQDTIPKQKTVTSSKITTKMNGHRYQLHTKNGEIDLFRVDGKLIPADSYYLYQDVLRDLQDRPILTPPTPPTPPSPPTPSAAPKPSAVPAIPKAPEPPSVPAPPTPPTPADPTAAPNAPQPPHPPHAPKPPKAPEPRHHEKHVLHLEVERAQMEQEIALEEMKAKMEVMRHNYEVLREKAENELLAEQMVHEKAYQNLLRDHQKMELEKQTSMEYELHRKREELENKMKAMESEVSKMDREKEILKSQMKSEKAKMKAVKNKSLKHE